MSVFMLLIAATLGIVAVIGVLVAFFWWGMQGRARRFGYPSVGSYLRAVPRTDEEKQDAVSLALKGVVMCLLGLLFPPLLLIGVFPLFYGGRKLAWASMGLGLVDDADQPSA